MVMAAPRILATTYDSLGLQLDRLQHASGPAELGLGAVRIASLCLPVGAMALSVGRSGRMAGRGLMRWSSGSVPRRLAASALIGCDRRGPGSLWWPNGEYQPIRPGERGTLGEAVSSVPDVAGGRPSFTRCAGADLRTGPDRSRAGGARPASARRAARSAPSRRHAAPPRTEPRPFDETR